MEDNICAIATSLGVGAISIIRCSGNTVIDVVNKIFKGKDLTKVKSHTIHYGYIIDNNEIIDEVLVTIMRSPKTYTKEDIVEINCHGGISTTNKVLELLLINGCRQALPGEFIKRAFLNGRIDLLEADAVNDLIRSETEESRKYAINRMRGNLSKKIENLRKKIINIEATYEVNFDFPEEADNPIITKESTLKELNDIKNNLFDLLKNSKNGSILNNGIDVAILGKPNVGKSSILNHLLDKEKAIVTEIAGTTRDIVEGKMNLDGINLNIIDTAGIRKTDDIVEKIGVNKSKEIAKTADLVIYVLSNNENITKEDIDIISNIDKNKLIIFINKSDLSKKINDNLIKEYDVSFGNTIDDNGLNNLKTLITNKFNLSQIKSKDYNYLSSSREISLIKNSLSSIINAIKGVEEDYPLEMISVDIKEAYDYLGNILGITYEDDLLDELFSKFCIGK